MKSIHHIWLSQPWLFGRISYKLVSALRLSSHQSFSEVKLGKQWKDHNCLTSVSNTAWGSPGKQRQVHPDTKAQAEAGDLCNTLTLWLPERGRCYSIRSLVGWQLGPGGHPVVEAPVQGFLGGGREDSIQDRCGLVGASPLHDSGDSSTHH